MALLTELLHYALLWLLLGASTNPLWPLRLALCGVVRMALTGMVGLLIIYVVMSWVQARSPIADVIQRLAEPLLRPLQRAATLKRLDLSALALLVLCAVLMVLAHVQASVLSL